jgi:hypothetical protein
MPVFVFFCAKMSETDLCCIIYPDNVEWEGNDLVNI